MVDTQKMWIRSNVASFIVRRISNSFIPKRIRPAKLWYCTNAVNQTNLIPAEIKYPSGNSKLKDYLESLPNKKHFNESIVRNILKQYEYRTTIVDQYKELINEMANETGSEIAALATEEKQRFTKILAEIDDEIVNDIILLNDDETDVSSIMIEVSAGVGGQEAMLFAREIFEMYANYIKFKNWDHDFIEEDNTGLGGIRSASILVRDSDAYDILKNEAGIHRVQRVPKTERSGRMHTSTAVVLVVPCADEIHVKLNPNDLRIETKRASGPGGQNVNKLESAVRIVHIPTGIAVECQEERTQVKNKQIAMRKLYNQLFQIEFTKQVSSQKNIRKSQAGLRTRNEKLRTYNYAQNRVTDHRLSGAGGSLHNLEEFIVGDDVFDEFITKANMFIRRQRINEIIDVN